MGLDCYVFAEPADADLNDKSTKVEEIWYGRKTNEIHGWMQRKSGIPAEEFNCHKLMLSHELLKEMKEDLFTHTLLHSGRFTSTKGSFFGGANDIQYVKDQVEQLIQAAEEALNQGKQVYYDSWW